jgi:hypothetical protein
VGGIIYNHLVHYINLQLSWFAKKAKVFCYENICLGSGRLQKDEEEAPRSALHFRVSWII